MASIGAAARRPKNRAPCLVAPVRTIALSRSSLGTWLGIRAASAGSCIARAVPNAKANTATCHSSSTSAIDIPAIAMTPTALAAMVAATSVFRSRASPIRPAIGETRRNGSIDAKVMMPTQADVSEALNTIHELATMKVHIAPPEDMDASHVSL